MMMNSQADTNIDLKAQAIAQTLRPKMILLPWFISMAVLLKDSASFHNLVVACVVLLLVYGSVTVLNDIADYETDVINKRIDIPLVKGTVTHAELMTLLIILSSGAFILAIAINLYVMVWTAVYLIMGWLYSGLPKFKNRPFLSLIVLGICYGVMPWLLGYALLVELPSLLRLGFMLASFIFVIGIMPLKDFKDIEGDKKTGKNTLLVTKGVNFVMRFIVSLTTLGLGMLVLLAIHINSWLLVATGCVLLVYNAWLLSDSRIASLKTVRAFRGKMSRVLFFFYAISVYIAI